MLGYNIVMWWNKHGHRRTKCRLRDVMVFVDGMFTTG